MYACVCVLVCAQGALEREEHRDLSLGRERVSRVGERDRWSGGRWKRWEVYREIKESRIYNSSRYQIGAPLLPSPFLSHANLLVALSRLGFIKLVAVWIRRFRFEPKKNSAEAASNSKIKATCAIEFVLVSSG